MSTSYATYEQYVTETGDSVTSCSRVEATLEELSAELRAECGLADKGPLGGDAGTLARKLVVDAARKALVPPSIDGFDTELAGVRQASFTGNGFTQSVTLSNSTGSAWFDSRSLSRFKRLVGRSPRWGYVWPGGC